MSQTPQWIPKKKLPQNFSKVAPQLMFTRIDDTCGNGVRVRKIQKDSLLDTSSDSSDDDKFDNDKSDDDDFLTREEEQIKTDNNNNNKKKKKKLIIAVRKNQDLISENALIVAVSSNTRSSGVSYCSLCGCFLLLGESNQDQIQGIKEELERLLSTSSSSSSTSSSSSLLSETAETLFEVSKEVEFTSEKEPLWFGLSSSSSLQRCKDCSENRCINPQLPQSLEECESYFSSSSSKILDSVASLKYLATEFDECLFALIRTVFMLFDEIWENENESNLKSSFRNHVDDFCSCFDEGTATTISGGKEIWRSACHDINFLLDCVFEKENSFSEKNQNENDEQESSSSSSSSWITLQQLFLLRCVLQTNQHRALVANPLAALMTSLEAVSSVSKEVAEKRLKILESCQQIYNNHKQQEENNELPETKEEEKETATETLFNIFEGEQLTTIECSSLFLQTSRLNHSCKCNADVGPSLWRRGASIRVVAREDIEEGSECRISYVYLDEIEKDKEGVHKRLKKHYGFDCDCEN